MGSMVALSVEQWTSDWQVMGSTPCWLLD